ncbi:MAG: cytochrome c [Alphaproteobacteria bacterium]|nr:cytochrome c [Alphaproteobacteria bacterium]
MRPLVAAIAILWTSGAAAQTAVSYTLAQAELGAIVYLENCQRCHGERLQGEFGPPLVGPPWDVHWRGGRALELFSFIRTNMPADFPGTLTPFQYADVLAFLLQRNGIPAGTEPLTPQVPRTWVIPDY